MHQLKYLAAAMMTQWMVAPSALAQPLKFDITGFSVEGNTLLPAEKIKSALSSFTGTGREMGDITKAAQALQTLYVGAGHAVVKVTAPEQTVSTSQVVLKVIEDKITAIEVKGNAAYDADNIRASLPALKMSTSLNVKQLDTAITLANENPAKQVAVNIQPSTQAGDIGTTINVTEDRITKYSATYDNAGSEATGFDKVGLAWQNANLFNLDHALTLQRFPRPA